MQDNESLAGLLNHFCASMLINFSLPRVQTRKAEFVQVLQNLRYVVMDRLQSVMLSLELFGGSYTALSHLKFKILNMTQWRFKRCRTRNSESNSATIFGAAADQTKHSLPRPSTHYFFGELSLMAVWWQAVATRTKHFKFSNCSVIQCIIMEIQYSMQ